jgi:16S rRNA processing protein RimM
MAVDSMKPVAVAQSVASDGNSASKPGDTTPQLIALAKVGRPYGLTGAVHLYPYSVDAQTLLKARTLTIGTTEFAVTRSRRHGESVVAQLVGVDSPEAAAKLTNKEIFVDRSLFPALPDGEYYWVDLVGLSCTNGEHVFGEITEIFESGAHPILRVKLAAGPKAGTDELIPFVDAIVRSVSLAERRVDVDWEGLD